MAPTLDDLPSELVALIVDALVKDDGLSSPLSLAVCSSHYQDIVEDIIWRDLFIRTGRHAKNILVSLKSRPKRGLLIRKIDLRAQYRHEVGLQKLPKVLDMTHNLQELTIESPTCNNSRWRGDGNWYPISQSIGSLLSHSALKTPAAFATNGPPLQILKRLTIHNNGGNARYWDLQSFAGIFLHPTLEELTLSCANIMPEATPIDNLPWPRGSTPLKSLTLIECNVNHVGLKAILACPSALQTLYLGENRDHSQEHYLMGFQKRMPSGGNVLATQAEQMRAALEQQAHSLQSLSYRPQTPNLLDESDHLSSELLATVPQLFAKLSQLDTLFIDAVLYESSQVERGALQAAPQLRELSVVHFEDQERMSRSRPDLPPISTQVLANKSLIYKLAQQCLISKTLEQLHIRISASRSIRYFRDQVNELAVGQTAKLLSSKNIGLKISYQLIKGGLIPPFLYNEVEEPSHLIFDSGAGGWQLLAEDVMVEQNAHYWAQDDYVASDVEDDDEDDEDDEADDEDGDDEGDEADLLETGLEDYGFGGLPLDFDPYLEAREEEVLMEEDLYE